MLELRLGLRASGGLGSRLFNSRDFEHCLLRPLPIKQKDVAHGLNVLGARLCGKLLFDFLLFHRAFAQQAHLHEFVRRKGVFELSEQGSTYARFTNLYNSV